MTRAEAVEVINEYGVLFPSDKQEALNMAIEALEQEPIIHCKDCKKWVNGDDRYGICNWNEYLTLQTAKDSFCSYGKRGSDEQ